MIPNSLSESTTTQLQDDVFFEQLRASEFSRLDKEGHFYFDYTGGNLYPQSLLDKHFAQLQNHVFGNPHSTNPTSLHATRLVNEARQKVLDFFNAEDYFCIFTANASGALNIVGECYPFSQDSCYLFTVDNHNSVNGIREFCTSKGGTCEIVTANYEDLTIHEPSLTDWLKKLSSKKEKLFAYPAQSNVSGVKHSLDYIRIAQDLGWDVLLDAAAYVPTSQLDLKKHTPDFVSVSFYKVFGYPTGIGCLLVRKDKFEKLHKPWFAGGTVSAVSINYPGYFLVNNHERFENGTVNYLGIPAITNGLQFIEQIGLDRINRRVQSITDYLLHTLENLIHDNGEPLIHILGSKDLDKKGGTIIFSVSGNNDKRYPVEFIEKGAAEHSLSVRVGCFCNPGIDEINYCVTPNEMARFFNSRNQGNYQDIVSFLGKHRGQVRISVGMATVQKDLDHLILFLRSYLNKPVPEEAFEWALQATH
ncbi:MAG: aminotransferase class V-fold PLP-dependent enzyme [Bacteroidetes bacterium]|nr:aminotransferase class V-fold PLP-dependent enzyme [Bacteroidota bacterium]